MVDEKPRRVTTDRLAEEAGVSLATVDRVLNARPGVRHETRERVLDAVKRLGYRRNVHAANLAKRRSYRFLFILPVRASSFGQNLENAVMQAPDAFPNEDVSVAVRHVDMIDPVALTDELERAGAGEWDGLAVKATDAPGIRQAIDRLVDNGVPVVTLVTDSPTSKREHFVGIDNVAAGRVAASLAGRFVPRAAGVIGVITGSLLMRDHVERRIGFEQVMSTEFPRLKVLPARESGDDPEVTERLTRDLLDNESDLVGIYSISAGNRGILKALAQAKRRRRLALVVHELSPHVRRALIDGTVSAAINQDVDHEARSALRILKALTDNQPYVPSQEEIRIDIYLRDNLP